VSDSAGIAFLAIAKIGRVRKSRRQEEFEGAEDEGLIKASLYDARIRRLATAEATKTTNGIFKS